MRIKKPNWLKNFQVIKIDNFKPITTPTPYNVKRLLNVKPHLKEKVDIEYLNFIEKEYRKWNKMKKNIKNYSKSWQTRIRNKILKYQSISNDMINAINSTSSSSNKINIYEEMQGRMPHEWSDSENHKFKILTNYYYEGDEAKAMEAFECFMKLAVK